MIQLESVHKRFGGHDVLKDMTLQVNRGECYVIMGRSGMGKSVTLKHIIGVLAPDRGRVLVTGKNVPEMGKKELMALRRSMGYLFQSGALINWLDVYENVALPLRENRIVPDSEVR